MGLDNFWRLPEGKEVTFKPPLKLCGGMLSGHGDGSFRGKVYDEIVEDVTRVSLYGDIDAATVKQMSEMLDGTPYDPEFEANFDIKKAEYNDLRRMFRTYADADANLAAWS